MEALILKKTSSPSWDLTLRLSCSVPGAGSVIDELGGWIMKEGVKYYIRFEILGGFIGEYWQSRFSRIHFYMLNDVSKLLALKSRKIVKIMHLLIHFVKSCF